MFYGLDEKQQGILRHILGVIDLLFKKTFHADQLITVERCMGFLEDKKFMDVVKNTAKTGQEKSLLWRLHTQIWAARQCLFLPGDFVECGVYKGFCSDTVIQYLDFDKSGKTFYLYDTFQGIPEQHRAGSPVRPGGYAEAGLYDHAVNRFAPFANVRVVKGVVPDILAQVCPERIAYLHLDMNSASAEIGALEALFERVTVGGMVVLDDYGWEWYRAQKTAEDAFFAARNHHVLELPTGQGLVVKHAGG